jgi:hypothetical protein
MIKLEALLICDKCSQPELWGQTDKEQPRCTFSVNTVTSWARSEGWSISKTRHLCPECKKKKKGR